MTVVGLFRAPSKEETQTDGTEHNPRALGTSLDMKNRRKNMASDTSQAHPMSLRSDCESSTVDVCLRRDLLAYHGQIQRECGHIVPPTPETQNDVKNRDLNMATDVHRSATED